MKTNFQALHVYYTKIKYFLLTQRREEFIFKHYKLYKRVLSYSQLKLKAKFNIIFNTHTAIIFYYNNKLFILYSTLLSHYSIFRTWKDLIADYTFRRIIEIWPTQPVISSKTTPKYWMNLLIELARGYNVAKS